MSKIKLEKLLEEVLLKMESAYKHTFSPFIENSETIVANLEKEINAFIREIYTSSKSENFYFLDCPLEVYKNTYETRLKLFYEECQEENESLFLKQELQDLINPFYPEYKIDYSKFRDYCQNKFYNASFNSKIEFIRQKLLELGWLVNLDPEVNSIPQYSESSYKTVYIKYTFDPSQIKMTKTPKTIVTEQDPKPNQLTSNQIILLLQEIGFFIHPKIELTSKVKQAELISSMTGIHQKTIKTNIQKLEKSLSLNGANYQKDIDKINKILDDLI
jgi:hypothetical protein